MHLKFVSVLKFGTQYALCDKF